MISMASNVYVILFGFIYIQNSLGLIDDNGVPLPNTHANCTNPCKYGDRTFCGHIPCPLPPCPITPVTTPGDCCPHCPKAGDKRIFCSSPCFQGSKFYCHQPPCPRLPCVDPVTTKGQCCGFCPNGSNCRIDGKIYPAFDETTVGDMVCSCQSTGPQGYGNCTRKNL